MRWCVRLTLVLIVAVLPIRLPAGALHEPVPAPDWQVSEWLNGDPGSLPDNKGRVVLIEFFQLWCPGCNRFSIPLFKSWNQKYGKRDDVLVVSIHTVFEGHDYQTPSRLREFVADQEILHPVGIDAYPAVGAELPVTMRRYRTGGTPHVVIVDKQGRLRFSHFGRFDPAEVEALIEELLAERIKNQTPKRSASHSRPRSPGGPM